MEAVFYIIVIAIVIGMLVANYKIAQSKGQSVPLWMVLGFLFNPIALIVQLVMKGSR